MIRGLRRRGFLALLGVGLLAGCGGGPTPAATPVAAPPAGSVTVGDVRLRVDVADTPEERAAGLRGRDVPPGYGMVFRYPAAQAVRFTMSEVTLPLVAVFVRDGRAVSVEQMVPCEGSVQECPTYGPAEPVDTVVEAAPGSLPDATAGDPVVVIG